MPMSRSFCSNSTTSSCMRPEVSRSGARRASWRYFLIFFEFGRSFADSISRSTIYYGEANALFQCPESDKTNQEASSRALSVLYKSTTKSRRPNAAHARGTSFLRWVLYRRKVPLVVLQLSGTLNGLNHWFSITGRGYARRRRCLRVTCAPAC